MGLNIDGRQQLQLSHFTLLADMLWKPPNGSPLKIFSAAATLNGVSSTGQQDHSGLFPLGRSQLELPLVNTQPPCLLLGQAHQEALCSGDEAFGDGDSVLRLLLTCSHTQQQ